LQLSAAMAAVATHNEAATIAIVFMSAPYGAIAIARS
jgi:hypothetical protein